MVLVEGKESDWTTSIRPLLLSRLGSGFEDWSSNLRFLVYDRVLGYSGTGVKGVSGENRPFSGASRDGVAYLATFAERRLGVLMGDFSNEDELCVG